MPEGLCDRADSAMSLLYRRHLKYLHGVCRLRDCEGGGAPLEDARLLRSDLRQRVAQNLHVVKAQGGDAADIGLLHHICGVQAAPQADLQDSSVHLLSQKYLQTCR